MKPHALLLTLTFAGLACDPWRSATVDLSMPPQLRTLPGFDEPRTETARPAGPGCAWQTYALYGHDSTFPLCFAVDEACFATVNSPFEGFATVFFPEGETASKGARLDLSADGIRLRAWTAGDVPVFYPRVPIVFGGIAIGSNGQNLHLERVRGDTIDLELRPGSGFKSLAGSFRSRASCLELAVEPASPSEKGIDTVAGRRPDISPTERYLLPGQTIRIAERFEGPDIAEVRGDDTLGETLEVLEQRAARSRILWSSTDAIYFGWVNTSSLSQTPPPDPANFALLPGPGPAPASPPPPGPGTRCQADVPLTADVAGTKSEVGVIEKGTRFDVREALGEVARVELRSRSVELEGNARWLVPAALLRDCRIE